MAAFTRLVPFHPCMKLGSYFNAKKFQVIDGTAPSRFVVQQTNTSDNAFLLAENFTEVCEFLQLPMEYALKVVTGLIENKGLENILQCVEDRKSITLMLRASFVKEIKTARENSDQAPQINDITHLIKQIEIGNELMLALTITCKDESKQEYYKKTLVNLLQSKSGQITEDSLNKLQTSAMVFDIILKSEECKGKIHTFSFNSTCPNSYREMIDSISKFIKTQWSSVEHYLCDDQNMQIYNVSEVNSSAENVVEGVECLRFYPLRAEIQSVNRIPGMTSTDCQTESAKTTFHDLYKIYLHCNRALPVYKKLFESDDYFFVADKISDKKISAESLLKNILGTIESLDLISLPPRRGLNLIKHNMDVHEKAMAFFEEITKKLPDGGDLRLMLLGKTGQGKSATGNTILNNKQAFVTGNDMSSVTSKAACQTAVIDKRSITVVDVPGVMATSLSQVKELMHHAIVSLSSGITWSTAGVHAFIVVLKLGTRLTIEERKSLSMLEDVIGKTFIETHTVFVITMGDNFERSDQVSFRQWVRNQTDPYFKRLMERCNYRCVLFDNTAIDKDPVLSKEQVVLLINYIDGMKKDIYTSPIFEKAANYYVDTVNTSSVSKMYLDYNVMAEIPHVLSMLNQAELDGDFNTFLIEKIKKIAVYLETHTGKNDQNFNALLVSMNDAINEAYHSPSYTISKEKRDALKDRINAITTKQKEINTAVELKVTKEVEAAGGCFPGMSRVIGSDGRLVPLEELRPGDRVLAMNKQNELVFDEVFMFGHHDKNRGAIFVVIHTSSGQATLTENHLIVCRQGKKEHYLAAGKINVGDEILQVESGEPVWSSVIRITRQYRQGLFAPFTRSGTIVVDGVLMSCYIDVLTHQACHRLMWPIRTLHRLTPKALEKINRTSDKQPIPKWANLAFNFVNFTKKGKL